MALDAIQDATYQPPVYDYGVNVVYQGDEVYVDGEPTATAKEYSVRLFGANNRMAAFRRPFQKRRCLIPADGFYEWKKTPEGRIPLFYRDERRAPFVFAGVWDGWQDPGTKEWLRTCVIITGEPNELAAQIHTRMPVILPPETHDAWLSGEAGKEILRPFPAEGMAAKAISKRINKPENNDPSVLEETEIEQTGRLI